MRHTEPRTVRFWVSYANGFVRLALRDGAEITIGGARETSEGWSGRWETYTRDGDTIMRRTITDGRDCDGRMSSESIDEWRVTDAPVCYGARPATLRELHSDPERQWPAITTPRPDWRTDRPARYRDHNAERTGY